MRMNLISIFSLFLLILAGGVVRSSGSGMGCPDWPKCFDQYIPPTDISQLPKDYQEKYVATRMEKNERFARLLEKTGYDDLAHKIRNDEKIHIPEEFNPAKTYTEYVNRLIGALTGIFLLLTFVYSFAFLKRTKRIAILSFLNLILVVFQAWLGSIVVSTNLIAWIITLHMLLAIVIIAVAIYTYHHAKALETRHSFPASDTKTLKTLVIVALVLSLVQIVVGTEVREAIDAVLSTQGDLARDLWLTRIDGIYTSHKNIALAVVAINILVFFIIKRKLIAHTIDTYANIILLLVILQFATGLALNFMGMPPVAQALHVWFAILFFSAQFYLLLMLIKTSKRL